MEIVQKEGKRDVSRELEYYNLDMIIAVGYRVNFKKATQFRIWATNVLRDYLTKGYAVNEKLLQSQKSKIEALQTSVSLLSRSLNNQIDTVKKAQDVANLLENFAKGLDLLYFSFSSNKILYKFFCFFSIIDNLYYFLCTMSSNNYSLSFCYKE